MYPLVALLLAAGVVTVGLAYKTAAEVVRLRGRLRARRRWIVDIGDGERCRMVGVVGPGPTLTAPLSGRACVAYLAEVIDESGDGADPIREQRGVPFSVIDETGQAVVDPAQAELCFESPPHAGLQALGAAVPARDLAFVRAHASARGAWRPGMRVRCREHTVSVGDRIAVIGHAAREPDPEGARRASGYRDALPTRVRLAASRGRSLIVTDRGDLTAD